MIELDSYITNDGLTYDCYFYPEEKKARAIGPLPPAKVDPEKAGEDAAVVTAESEREAREKLAEILGPGSF